MVRHIIVWFSLPTQAKSLVNFFLEGKTTIEHNANKNTSTIDFQQNAYANDFKQLIRSNLP
jgi:hypothetical protein